MNNLTSSNFADKIAVNRSRMSHILTGRNNPSLEIIQTILAKFPDLNPDWLLFGKSPIKRGKTAVSETSGQTSLFDLPKESKIENNDVIKKKTIVSKEPMIKVEEQIKIKPVVKELKEAKIKMITVYFDNNTYLNLYPESGK